MVPPQQRISEDWYQGTADAVHQNVYRLRREARDYTLILSSDHIYRMDYGPLLERHVATGAALTIGGIAVVPKAMDLSTCKGQAPVSKTEGRFSANGRSALAHSWKSQSAPLPVP